MPPPPPSHPGCPRIRGGSESVIHFDCPVANGRVEHCEVWGCDGIGKGIGIEATAGADPSIIASHVHDCSEGVRFSRGETPEGGARGLGPGTKGRLEGCVFQRNKKGDVVIEDGCEPALSGNTFGPDDPAGPHRQHVLRVPAPTSRLG